MLVELYSHPQFGKIFKLAAFGYGHEPTSLVCRLPDGERIRLVSEEGSRQGCVLGTLLYCFAKKTPFEDAVKDLPSTTATAFADDFTAVGEGLELAKVASRLIASGHNFNLDKTKLVWPHTTAVPLDIAKAFQDLNIEILHNVGHKILGAYLSLPHHQDQAKRFALEQASDHGDLFKALNSSFLPLHTTYYMLRFAAQPRMIFQTRLTAMPIARDAFQHFDERITEVVSKLFKMPNNDSIDAHGARSPNPPVPASALQQTQMPCHQGGKGIRAISSLANAAFYASYTRCLADTQPLVTQARAQGRLGVNEHCTSTQHALQAHQALIASGVTHSQENTYTLKANQGGECISPKSPILPTNFHNTQQFYSDTINSPAFKLQKIVTFQKENADEAASRAHNSKRTNARLQCLKLPGASAILNPWPSSVSHPRKQLSDLEFATFMNFTSGIAPYKNLPNCPCGYSYNPEDPNSDETHGLSCKKFHGLRIMMHDALKCLATTQARRAGLAATNEPPTDREGTRIRPDGLQLFASGLNYTDTRTVHPLTPSRIASGVAGTKKPLNTAFKSKNDKFNYAGFKNVCDAGGHVIGRAESFCKQENATFHALAIETYGGLHPSYTKFLKRLLDEATAGHLCVDTTAERNAYYASLVSETQATMISHVTNIFRFHAKRCHRAGFAQNQLARRAAPNLGPAFALELANLQSAAEMDAGAASQF
jgi:hypothetical protein